MAGRVPRVLGCRKTSYTFRSSAVNRSSHTGMTLPPLCDKSLALYSILLRAIIPLIADADLSGELINTQLGALPAHWCAVQERAASRQRSGPDEHQTARRRLQACRNLEDKAVPLALQGVTQAPIRRAQVFDRDSLALQPLQGQAGGQHERAIGFAFIGEEVERRADEVGRHPAMRHITHKAWLAQLATYHFGPLVPAGWPLAGEKEVEQFLSALAPAETHKCPHGAQLIGGVIVPGYHTIPSCDECLPVALERGKQQLLWHMGLLPAGVESNGRGGSVEIAEFGAARQVGNAVRCRAHGQRGVQIVPKLVALPSEPSRRLLMAK